MYVIVKINQVPEQIFLVKIEENKVKKQVIRLTNKRKFATAMTKALSHGKFIQEIKNSQLPFIKADMILSEKNANFDLT